MKKLLKSKKGSIVDIIFVMVVLLFFGMVVLVGSKIGTEVNDQIQSSSAIDANTKVQADRTLNNATNSIDNTFLFLTIFIAIVIMVLAALVRVHPIFIPIFFIAWIMLIFLAGIFSNIYQSMAANTELVAVSSDLLFISTILNALPIIIGVFGILLMTVMYKLWSAGQ